MDAVSFFKRMEKNVYTSKKCEGCDLLEPHSSSCRIFMKEYDFTDDKIKERII